MKEVVIVSACRTAVGKYGGAFKNVPAVDLGAVVIEEAVKRAGISKDITFHCFRHTFATLQLFNGTDIYTVSKMLGHKDLKTTQIYAKIVDDTKRKAADKIKLDM